jgi:hypothetical protein
MYCYCAGEQRLLPSRLCDSLGFHSMQFLVGLRVFSLLNCYSLAYFPGTASIRRVFPRDVMQNPAQYLIRLLLLR